MAHAKPCRDGVTALHPAKHPGDGAQIFQTAALLAAGWTRSDAGMFQFVYRCGLLEVFDYSGIFRDVLAVECESFTRHLLHGWNPTLVGSRLRASGTSNGL